MKKILVCAVGVGNRGIAYSDYAIKNPEAMQLISVVDPNKQHRDTFAETHNIPENMRFESVEDFVKAKIQCDLVLNCTIDNLHYKISKVLLENKYNVLMEKPITADRGELLDLERLAKENNCMVFVCHVLRYTNFYRTIKELIDRGEVGKIMSIHMSEHVGVMHYVESYSVGKWKSEKECGSSFLLAKSCHDTDLMTWFNEGATPEYVSSFGDRKLFIDANAPKGHAERCVYCPYSKECRYSTERIFLNERGWLLERLKLDIKKPKDEITKEDIYEHLKTSDYGKCAYETKDLLDRQNIIVKFDNGCLVSFDLIGGAPGGDRYIHIVGEKGEISGQMGTGKLLVRRFDFDKFESTTETIDVRTGMGGHGGGDEGIMRDITKYLNGDRSSISITKLSDSVNGHLLVYAADKSQRTGEVVNFKKEFNR